MAFEVKLKGNSEGIFSRQIVQKGLSNIYICVCMFIGYLCDHFFLCPSLSICSYFFIHLLQMLLYILCLFTYIHILSYQIHIHIHIHIHIYIRIHIRIRIHIYICVCSHVYIYNLYLYHIFHWMATPAMNRPLQKDRCLVALHGIQFRQQIGRRRKAQQLGDQQIPRRFSKRRPWHNQWRPPQLFFAKKTKTMVG